MFKIFLNYKLAAAGGQLVELPAHYTSQTCSECGVIDAASRKAQANFLCAACGHEDNADINAAINILRRWDTALLPVEATGYRAVEAGTIRRTA
jgi:putative transposase